MPETALKRFAQEVKEGLESSPKRISSKWFYDKKGDELFVQIMQLPEYYLTRSEESIFNRQTDLLVKTLTGRFESFDLVELGAGDGTKTFHLIKALDPSRFRYRPVDISKSAIKKLQRSVSFHFPNVQIDALVGEYFEVLTSLKGDQPKAILFMGSNIGNLLDDRANLFLKGLSETMRKGDTLLLGVDLKKSKELILPAYNDAQGITAAFNLNLLERINRELGGNFDLSQFKHVPSYDEEEGVAYSHIMSRIEQEVYVGSLEKSFHFSQGERLFTEISRKYDDEALDRITRDTRLTLVDKFYDDDGLFCDAIYVRD